MVDTLIYLLKAPFVDFIIIVFIGMTIAACVYDDHHHD